ncbi:unnamed protein product [Cunninghamella echinulata]
MPLYSFHIILVLLLLFPFITTGYNGDPNVGLILYAQNGNTRSGVLSADHRCQNYPDQFPVSSIENKGYVHCSLWTEENCQGRLYVVPAHYSIGKPLGVSFKSVIYINK